MHLKGVTILDRMRIQRDHSINKRDFSANAKLPDATPPRSWAELQDAATGLVAYCNAYADQTTAQLAYTVAGFVSAMQAFGHWPENRLEALEFWINDRLGAYRELIDVEVRTGANYRSEAMAWFSPTNPTLAPLQHLMLQKEMAAIQASTTRIGSHSSFSATTRVASHVAQPAAPKGVPHNVSALIPKKNNHELCLRFASQRGCKSTASFCGGGDRTREHFVAKPLPKEVRAYIVSKFGALSADYSAQS